MKNLTATLLRKMPLPDPDARGDKSARGSVLVVGGGTTVPGAMLLAGVAALRAGAGKLQLATVEKAAIALGVAVPEALVVGLPTRRDGQIDGARAARPLERYVEEAHVVLVGPGMMDNRPARALADKITKRMNETAILILDAATIPAVRDGLGDRLPGRLIITPHGGEMAKLLDLERREVETDMARVAAEASKKFNVVVALKGAETLIAQPDGTLWKFSGGTVGLATSGSGDTLAGVAAGFAARCQSAAQAIAWAVYVHGAAGRVLSERVGLGFLARELLDEIPTVARKTG